MKIPLYFLICTSLAVATSDGAVGPLDRGSQIVSSHFFISHNSGDLYDDITVVEIAPASGFFVSPRFTFGGEFLFRLESQNDRTEVRWAVAPAFGYYATSRLDNARGSTFPYIRIAAGIGMNHVDDKRWKFAFASGQTGLIHMVSDGVGIDATIRVQGDAEESGFASGWGGGVTVFFGIGVAAFVY